MMTAKEQLLILIDELPEPALELVLEFALFVKSRYLENASKSPNESLKTPEAAIKSDSKSPFEQCFGTLTLDESEDFENTRIDQDLAQAHEDELS